MRIDLPDVSKFRPRQRDQVVNNAETKFPDNVNLATQQQVKMLSHRPRQRVLNRNHGAPDRAFAYAVKNLKRAGTRDDLRARQHGFSRLMAKGTEFTLNSNFHESSS